MSKDSNLQNQESEPMDFLTPEQRLDAIADILSTIALRIAKQNHEQEITTHA